MELKKGRILFPIKNARESKYYPLIFEDSDEVTHYFDFDGEYDGWSHKTEGDKI